MKASLKNYRQAPRKVRLVTDSVKGKSVRKALDELRFMPQKAAAPVAKLVASAFANARQGNPTLSEGEVTVENITVDKGITFFRFRARARGRASKIGKESSHVHVTLSGPATEPQEAPKPTKKTEKKVETTSDDKASTEKK